MKTKFLGLLAVGLLAGPMAASAAVVYEYTESLAADPGYYSFSITTPGFISVGTAFDPVVCTDGTCSASFVPNTSYLAGPIDALGITSPITLQLLLREFPVGSFGAFGTYNGFSLGTTTLAGTLTVKAAPVPEPGTLALLGLGLAGLGLSWRRKAH